MSRIDHGPVWGHSDVPLEALRADLEVDTCVIGLGGSGLAAIHELLDMGHRVAGLDAAGVAAGAAGRNGGFLLGGCAAFHHVAAQRLGRDRAVAIYRQTLAQIDRMATETPEAVRRTGSLRIAHDDAERADCIAQHDMMRGDGLPVELHDGVEGVGLLFPHDAAFDPARRCALLARRAVDRGALLHAPAPVTAIEGTTVHVGGYRIACENVLVMVDGALAQLLPELASQVRTARLQMLATAPLGEMIFTRPVYYREGYEYWQQLPDTTLVLGGFRDRAGDAEWTDAATPGGLVQGMLDAFLRAHLRVTAPVTHRWAASVGYRDGVLPWVGKVRPGVWAAGGYNGTGNVIGAICGRGLARLAAVADGTVLQHLLPLE